MQQPPVVHLIALLLLRQPPHPLRKAVDVALLLLKGLHTPLLLGCLVAQRCQLPEQCITSMSITGTFNCIGLRAQNSGVVQVTPGHLEDCKASLHHDGAWGLGLHDGFACMPLQTFAIPSKACCQAYKQQLYQQAVPSLNVER